MKEQYKHNLAFYSRSLVVGKGVNVCCNSSLTPKTPSPQVITFPMAKSGSAQNISLLAPPNPPSWGLL